MSSFFDRNATLKIISIIIGLILWSMTPSNRDPLRDISFRDIPIKIEDQQKLSDNGLMISSEMPDSYSFDIRTKSSMVKYLDRSKIIATINLSDINKTGVQKVAVELEGLPSNIEIKSAPDMEINIERIVSKTVPVLPKIADKDSIELGKRYYEINPKFIQVWGPESLIGAAAYAEVALSLGAGARDKKLERSLKVQLLDNGDELLETELITINPEYAVVSIYPNKSVKINPVVTGEPADGFVVMGEEVKPSEILINGNPEVLSAIESIDTDILDIEGATRDVAKDLNLQQQEGIRLSPGQSSTIQVLVRIEKVIDKQVSFEDIEMRNVSDGLQAKFDGEEDMVVMLRGPQSLVSNFNPKNLKVYVDLNDSSRGERSYPLSIDKLPAGMEILNIEPEKLKVTIE